MPAQAPDEFREQLLGMQGTTPALRDEYSRALATILYHKLTPRTRAVAWAALLGCVAGAVMCVRAAIIHHDKPDARIILPTYAVVAVLAAGWIAKVLWRGGFARRSSFAVVEWLGGLFVSVFVAVTLLRGMQDPSNPASTFSAVLAVLLVMVGFAWGTGNRIAAATLETREHLLRLESRLVDLAERLGR
jgi:hypothetical protein